MSTRVTAALGIAVLVALTGCSAVDTVIGPKGVRTDFELTPAQARADLADSSDDLQSVLGGQWQNNDNFIATGCGLDKGYYYYGSRTRLENVTDSAAAVDDVEARWKKLGYSVDTKKLMNDYLLQGVSPNGLIINLTLGEKHTDFSTDGPCLTGDPYKVRREDVKNNRNDFPRDPTPTPTPTPTPAG